ncbi:MAG TPA: glycosyltransferase family 1 protein [Firmicutes bacterium]|nr:glycosyltransferase family 1 protein [Bacillota bacterium]
MIKVAHIITRMCQGGAQENTYLTVKYLMKKNFHVDLITGRLSKGEKEIRFPLDDINVIHIDELVREINPLKDLIAFLKIYRILKNGKYDIVHTHTSKAGVLGRIAAKFAKVPVIIHTPHGHVFYGYFPKFLTKIIIFVERILAKFTDAIITLSEKSKQEHLQNGIGKESQYVKIISGIEVEKYVKENFENINFRRRLNIGENKFIIGCASRLVSVKGINYLIESMRFLDDKFVLLIAGEGEERDFLEKLVKEYGLEKKVYFLGMLDDLREFLANIDVFVLPSLNEGMGRVLVEAGLMEKPCVATRVGGIPEVVIDGKTGFLVSPGSGQEIAERLKYFEKNPHMMKVMGRNAKIYVKDRFSAKIMCEKIESLYRDILKRKERWKLKIFSGKNKEF